MTRGIAKEVKWYKSKWFYYIIIALVAVAIYFLIRDTVNQTNLAKYLKQQNETFRGEIKRKDKIIDSLIIQKNKIKVIREKVDTKAEEELINKLQLELAELRKKQTNITSDTLTPEKLNEYFINLINK